MACVSRLAAVTLVAFLALSAAPAGDAKVVRNGQLELQSIIGALRAQKKAPNTYQTLLTLITKAGLVPYLAGYLGSTTTGFTLLAPNDAAFKKVPATVLRTLMTRTVQLQNVLKLHMLNFQLLPAKLVADKVGQGYTTLVPKAILQKYKNGGGFFRVGPQGAQTDAQLAGVVKPNIFKDTVAAVHGINTVLGIKA